IAIGWRSRRHKSRARIERAVASKDSIVAVLPLAARPKLAVEGMFAGGSDLLGAGLGACSQKLRQALVGFPVMQLFFPESVFGPGGDGGLLLVRIVGNQHAGDRLKLHVGLDLLDYIEAVAVILIELAIDEHQIER